MSTLDVFSPSRAIKAIRFTPLPASALPAFSRRAGKRPERYAPAGVAPARLLRRAAGEHDDGPLVLAAERRDGGGGKRDVLVRQDLFLVHVAVLVVDEPGVEVAGHEARVAQDPLIRSEERRVG